MYLYRESSLRECLDREDVHNFLSLCGYDNFDIDGVLAYLRMRLSETDEFPHEIGVFLGYPLSDVIAFIRNEGQNCLCCGCWKVYSNECDAMRVFMRFRKCKEVYKRLFQSGRPLSNLAVATRLQ